MEEWAREKYGCIYNDELNKNAGTEFAESG
jgi:hypothetical protein